MLQTNSLKFGIPSTYRGLQAFHKYWGKKPSDVSADIVKILCPEKGIVMDPFLGGGLLARICGDIDRRFVGVDINPISAELAKMFLSLPDAESYNKCLDDLRVSAKPDIEKSYRTENTEIATHFLWNKDILESVWHKNSNNKREEITPKTEDIKLASSYKQYKPKHLRRITTFSNSRINASADMALSDIFKPRASANIDILVNRILAIEDDTLRRSFLLTLTAASGQMSNFVFAIRNRGKNSRQKPAAAKTEVGSWSVGFWRPALHFEINVWNCFVNRANRMAKILQDDLLQNSYAWTENIDDFFLSDYQTALLTEAAQSAIDKLPDDSVDFIFTDPPHSDRIPYLELSEIWNSILQTGMVDFSKEIVVSNAKERNKTAEEYNKDMQTVFAKCSRVLKPEGYLAVIYNNSEEDWAMLPKLPDWNFICRFDLNYSAGSLMQDNRKGALRKDYVFLFSKTEEASKNFPFKYFEEMPGFAI